MPKPRVAFPAELLAATRLALEEPERPYWRDDAACRGMDVSEFFATESGESKANAPHKTICPSCPVRADCLATGIRGREHGTWGGYTQEARRRVVKALGYAQPMTLVDPNDFVGIPRPPRSGRQMISAVCEWCNEGFVTRKRTDKVVRFCSNSCHRLAYWDRKRKGAA